MLQDAQAYGFIGPGCVDSQICRSLAFAAAYGQLSPQSPPLAVDLGSGGGLPALPLVLAWSDSRWVLIESNHRRAAHLTRAVNHLGLDNRVSVRCERAEDTGRTEFRARAHLVTARGFGSPAPTAECAAPLLCLGGHLLVAEPPGGRPQRWDPDGLAKLGMQTSVAFRTPIALQALRQVRPCPTLYPRRVGTPAKRPLFTES